MVAMVTTVGTEVSVVSGGNDAEGDGGNGGRHARIACAGFCA